MTAINGVTFTPQEEECVRLALDAYEAEMDGNADSLEPVPSGPDYEHDRKAVATYRNEAAVARSAREKYRQVTNK